MEEKGYQRVHKVRIRKGEVIEKAAEFEHSAFSLLYKKAKKMIWDIVQEQEENGGNGHLLSFMGERGSGKTTAMLSFLHALKEGKIYEDDASETQIKARFVTFEVIDASMLEEEEDLFEIILAQMLVGFLEECDKEGSYRDAWGEGKRDDRKEIQKMFNDLLERFRSLKGNSAGEELSSLASLKNLSFSSRLRQYFQKLVNAYISYRQGTSLEDCTPCRQTYLVFAIDDLDMNIAKGFEMLAQIHRYMLVNNVIIVMTAKYEQLEILGRKYFSKMVERLDRQTEDWKVDYLNRTVKEYLEKMLPSYYRLYLPDFEDRAMGYGDDLIVEKEKKIVKEAVIGKIFRRTGVYFDGSGEKRHFLMPTSMRGLNDYYIFLNELVKLSQDGGNNKSGKKEKALQLDNLDKFENDFVYRYIVERLEIEERREIHKLLKENFTQWNRYLCQFVSQEIVPQPIRRGYRILERMYIDGRAGFGNALWGANWCVKNGQKTREWMECIIVLYSLELNKWIIKNRHLSRHIFGKSVVGNWANQMIPQVIIPDAANKKVQLRYCGDIKGCRANIDFTWDVDTVPTEENLMEWLQKYGKNIVAIEVISMFFEGFCGSTRKQEKIMFGAYAGVGEKGKLQANVRIINRRADFNILGFMSNLLEYETFYEEYQTAFLQSWLDFVKVEKEKKDDKLQKMKKVIRVDSGLSLYREIIAWNRKSKGLVLPYQHTDVYMNLLAELQQWSMTNLQRIFSPDGIWEVFRDIIFQIENILKEKEAFLKKAEDAYNNCLLTYYRECPIIKCIKDPGDKDMKETLPTMFRKVFERCVSMNDYDSLYKPVNEIDTPEDGNTEDI